MTAEQKKILKYNETKNPKIDIGRIQDNHIAESTIYEENGYKLISTPSKQAGINAGENQNATQQTKQNEKQLRNKWEEV